MIGQYPTIVSQTIPSNYLLELLGSRPFQIVFQIVLLGTLIETGAGMIHAVNERIDGIESGRDNRWDGLQGNRWP